MEKVVKLAKIFKNLSSMNKEGENNVLVQLN